MLNMRLVIVGFLCVAAAGADAQSFEQQLFQFSQHAAATARQSREDLINAQAAARQERNAWHKLSGFNDTFTIEMPAIPVYTAVPAKVPNSGTPFNYHMYEVNEGGRLFISVTAILPEGTTYSMQVGLDGVAKNMGLEKWISTTWTKHQGLPAVEAIALKNGTEYRVFIVLRGLQYFAVMYAGPDGTARSEDVNRCFSSLNIR